MGITLSIIIHYILQCPILSPNVAIRIRGGLLHCGRRQWFVRCTLTTLRPFGCNHALVQRWGCKVGTGKGEIETDTFCAGTATVADAAMVPVLAISSLPWGDDSIQYRGHLP